MTIVVVKQQLARRHCNVEALGRPLEVVARSLSGDLSVELTFGVLLPPLIGLIDRHRNEASFEHVHNFGVGEGRRTVEHTVVSCTAQRVAIHRPDENRLLLLYGGSLSIEQCNLPRDCSPWFIGGGPKLLVQPSEFGLRQFASEKCGQEYLIDKCSTEHAERTSDDLQITPHES